ncbi:SGNH hydrolase-type esterase domain-containing protein [Xylariaceae sp. FL0255]|nr:SGNH hydrolase-type esterase domain-containing protein [Xylariaceae sp. FL0255]
MVSYVVTALVLAGTVASQELVWAQCGGIGFTGATTCVSGTTCISLNDYYSQCQPSASTATTTLVMTTTTTTASSPATSSPTSTATPQVYFLGRVNPVTNELSWPGTGVAFTFTGTSASIGLTSVTGTNSADLFVDRGNATVISNVNGTSIDVTGLSSGTHTIELRKRSEALYGSIFIGEVTVDGKLGVYTAPSRRIEIIGDSISVGYGLDGVYPCTNTAALEDNPKTYGALAAESLGADYSVIAWSGKGLVRNDATGSVDTSPLMPELYTRYGANDADNSYTFPAATAPQAVVIALGTNDWSYIAYYANGTAYDGRDPIDPSTFTAGMVSFVQTIEGHYPDANFFLLNSPLLSDTFPTAADKQWTSLTDAIQAAITQLGGSNVHFVNWNTQGSDVGCDYHPDAATHAAEAVVLADAISEVLGW